VSSAGVVVWFTGLPSSGKSTLARHALLTLRERAAPTVLLDGDDVRACLVPTPGYDEIERSDFYESLARLAALLARQGFVVLVPATAHRTIFRQRARLLAPRFVEVWVQTPAQDCAERDARGLWARARAGEAPALPGPGVVYEPPAAPELIADGGFDERACEAVVAAALAA
jgi:adenylylsulfate kinase